MKKIKGNSAVTLIALIITIIVLLILAGVTLNMVMGENGIFRKANWASFTAEYSQIQESSNLYNTEQKLDDYGNTTVVSKEEKEYYATTGEEITPEGTLKKTIEQAENIEEAKLYEIDLNKINVNSKNKYAVNIKTGKVYRIQGFSYNGLLYHIPEISMDPDGVSPEIEEYKLEENYHFYSTAGEKATVTFKIKLEGKLEGAEVTITNPESNNAVIEGSYDSANKIYTGTIETNTNVNPNGSYTYKIIAKKDGKEYTASKIVTISKFLNNPSFEIVNLKWNSFEIKPTDYPVDAKISFKYYLDGTSKSSSTITGLTENTKYTVKVEAIISSSDKGSTEQEVITSERVSDIYKIEDLEAIQDNKDSKNYINGKYNLKSDLDFKDRNSYATDEKYNYYTTDADGDGYPDNVFQIQGIFVGEFNGEGHTIKNYTASKEEYGGLFYRIRNATIENLLIKDADIKITNHTAGILASELREGGTISKVGVTGKITNTGKSNNIGSIIGNIYFTSMTFENCYAITTITTSGSYDIGGFASTADAKHVTVNNCYYSGEIVGPTNVYRASTFVGGGPISNNNNMKGPGVLTNCFYDKTKFTFEVSPSGTGLTTDEMKNAANYTGTNEDDTKAWDFKESDSDTDYTWYIDPNVNDGYPELHF